MMIRTNYSAQVRFGGPGDWIKQKLKQGVDKSLDAVEKGVDKGMELAGKGAQKSVEVGKEQYENGNDAKKAAMEVVAAGVLFKATAVSAAIPGVNIFLTPALALGGLVAGGMGVYHGRQALKNRNKGQTEKPAEQPQKPVEAPKESLDDKLNKAEETAKTVANVVKGIIKK